MKYQMAPMEGITTYIYRNAFAHHFGGISTYYTPFLSPHKDKTINHKEYQDIMPQNNEQIRVVPQILTASAEDFHKTIAEIRDMGYREVNLNCGCPSATVTSKHKGAGLLLDVERLELLLDHIFEETDIDISVKTRIGYDNASEWEDIMRIYEKYPMKQLIIHPRVRQDFYKNSPNKEAFRMAYESWKGELIYNGNLFRLQDIQALEQEFPNLAGCMLGRGLIANPGLIQEKEENTLLSKDTLLAFHDEIYEEYGKIQSGEKNVLYRMKELWFYMAKVFGDCPKYEKKIRKAQSCRDYELAVKDIFRDLEITPETTAKVNF